MSDKNVPLPREKVEHLVEWTKYCAQGSGDNVHVSYRDKNKSFMDANNFKTDDVRNCLLRLRTEDYSTTSYEEGKTEAHVFSAYIMGLEIYLKYKIINEKVLINVVSFHEPELGPLEHPYRLKKGEH